MFLDIRHHLVNVAQLGIDFVSVTRDGVDADEMFPSNPVTADELGGPLFPEGGTR